jgi:hypothetical protein
MAGWATLNGKIFVVGGDNNSGIYESDVWSSSDGKNWVQLTNSVPWAPRVLHYVSAFGGAMYVIGGQQLPEMLVPAPNPYPTRPVNYADIWRSSDGANWEQIGSVPHAIGVICGSVVFNNEIWIIGGGQYQDVNIPVAAQVYNEVWSSKNGVNWTQHADAPWLARRYHNVTAFDGKLWVMAGAPPTDVDRADVWYSEDGETWTELPGTPWVARHAATTFVLNDALYMTGGTDNGQIQHNDVWRLD